MAWRIKEVSTEAGGLGFVYIQKTLIILFPITLLLTLIYQFTKSLQATMIKRRWKLPIKNKWN